MAMTTGKHGFAVLTGAATSCAKLEMIERRRAGTHAGGPTQFCHWCQEATPCGWDHVSWECSAQLFAQGRPRPPEDPLQRRLGWPVLAGLHGMRTKKAHVRYGWAVLQHLIKVRKILLDFNY